jgi:hypothetical protein
MPDIKTDTVLHYQNYDIVASRPITIRHQPENCYITTMYHKSLGGYTFSVQLLEPTIDNVTDIRFETVSEGRDYNVIATIFPEHNEYREIVGMTACYIFYDVYHGMMVKRVEYHQKAGYHIPEFIYEDICWK